MASMKKRPRIVSPAISFKIVTPKVVNCWVLRVVKSVREVVKTSPVSPIVIVKSLFTFAIVLKVWTFPIVILLEWLVLENFDFEIVAVGFVVSGSVDQVGNSDSGNLVISVMVVECC